MNAPAKANPIVLSPRADLLEVIKTELKGLGVNNLVLPKNRDDCIEKLVKSPASVLVVDWELGSETINAILGAIKGHFLVETRPVFLVTNEITDGIIATAAEYGVSQVHAGPISKDTIKECLAALFKEDSETEVIRDTLIQVANARSKGDWSLATPLLIELHDKLPDQERVAVELAENLIYENNWDAALELLEPFTTLEPPSTRALHLKGRCLMQLSRYDEAIAALGKAKLLNPHNVDRLIDLGHAYLGNDQIDHAMENFEAAQVLDPDNKDATVGKGQCLLMNGEVNEALGLLKAISGPRELASIFNTAAVLSMRSGYYEKGMSLYKSALTAVGRNDKLQARLVFNMGLGYKRWGKAERAIACFQKSLDLDPSYAKAMKHKDALEGKAGKAGGGKTVDSFAEETFVQKPADASRRVLHDDTEVFEVGEDEDE